MIGFVATIALVALSLGSQVGLATADGPPKLNVAPSCDAAARGSVGRNAQSCMDDEREAKDSLTKTWLQYSRAHKTPCVGMTTRGGPSSYVELISCLEIMKDAAAIYKTDPLFGNLEKTPMKPTQPANRSTKTIGASAPPL
jgi:hypothetical protein